MNSVKEEQLRVNMGINMLREKVKEHQQNGLSVMVGLPFAIAGEDSLSQSLYSNLNSLMLGHSTTVGKQGH
ncbi:unnamed protein product [Urochloa humidicola]